MAVLARPLVRSGQPLVSHQAAGFANVLPQVPSPETPHLLRADR